MPKELFHHSVMNISNAFNGQKSAVMS